MADVPQPGKAPASAVLEPGRNCWRIERAGRASLIVDAADYYRMARQAMLEARSQIILIGWDVDTRVTLDEEKGQSGAPIALGPLLSWLTRRRPDLCIYILAWDEGLISVPGRGTTFFRMLRWWFDSQITIKWDSTHPLDASHHQKILVIDDALAFCGGIDITADRWDTRDHKDEEPGRKRPFTHRSYEPWHDAIMAVDGGAAKALGELARKRWYAATTNDHLAVPAPGSDPWPAELEPTFRDVPVAIARTRGHEGPNTELREIEALFLDLIAAAKRIVYFETQYFASRVVAEAIAARLAEPDGPEFVVVNPRTAYGWLDEAVMSPARSELVKTLRERDPHGRFRIYTPVTEGGLNIYVHAKIMIVDDEYLRVGSANVNNRSMGLDSECDVLIDASSDPEARNTIARLRCDLVAEHLGVEAGDVYGCLEQAGSLIGAIEKLRGGGRTLLPFEPREPNAAEKAIARSELLDPEAPNELFDPRAARPGLLSRLKGGKATYRSAARSPAKRPVRGRTPRSAQEDDSMDADSPLAHTPSAAADSRLWKWGAAAAVGAVLAGTAVLNQRRARRAEEDNPPLGRFLTVDGVRLHYVEHGEGPPLVLLHGNGTMIEDWLVSGLVGKLAADHRVIAFDRAGFGHSRRPRSRVWTPAAQAALLAEALRMLEVEKAFIVGHSFGTLVALGLALDHRAAVSGLALLGGYFYPTARGDVVAAAPPAIPGVGDVMRYTVSPLLGSAAMPAIETKIFSPAPVPDNWREGFPTAMTLRPSQIRAEAAEAALLIPSAAAFAKRYRELDLPLAIVAGRGDALVDPMKQSMRLHHALPHSRLTLIEGAGHMVHQTAPDEVLAAIVEAAR